MIYDPHVPLTTSEPHTECKVAFFSERVCTQSVAHDAGGNLVGSGGRISRRVGTAASCQQLRKDTGACRWLWWTHLLYVVIHLCFYCGTCVTAGSIRLAQGLCNYGRRVQRPCYIRPVWGFFFFPHLGAVRQPFTEWGFMQHFLFRGILAAHVLMEVVLSHFSNGFVHSLGFFLGWFGDQVIKLYPKMFPLVQATHTSGSS